MCHGKRENGESVAGSVQCGSVAAPAGGDDALPKYTRGGFYLVTSSSAYAAVVDEGPRVSRHAERAAMICAATTMSSGVVSLKFS